MFKNKLKLLVFIFVFAFASPVFAQNYYEQGKKEFYKGNYYVAQRMFLKELQQNPDNYPCRYFLAHTYVYGSDILKAKEEYNKIITFSPVHSVKKLAMESLYNLNNAENTEDNTIKIQQTFGDDYYEYIKLDGKYVRWTAFPLNVYVYPCNEAVFLKNAFIRWAKATNGLVSFNFVGNVDEAQITVSMTDKLLTPYSEGFEAGLATINARNNVIYKSHIDILKANPNTGEKFDNDMILTTTMHEVGHAIGIQGHSPNDSDLMTAVNHSGVKNITQRDLNTLRRLYRSYDR